MYRKIDQLDSWFIFQWSKRPQEMSCLRARKSLEQEVSPSLWRDTKVYWSEGFAPLTWRDLSRAHTNPCMYFSYVILHERKNLSDPIWTAEPGSLGMTGEFVPSTSWPILCFGSEGRRWTSWALCQITCPAIQYCLLCMNSSQQVSQICHKEQRLETMKISGPMLARAEYFPQMCTQVLLLEWLLKWMVLFVQMDGFFW